MHAKSDDDSAELKIGDTVQTTAGERGKIVHISRMTYFVALQREGAEATLVGLLESDLAKIEPPDERG